MDNFDCREEFYDLIKSRGFKGLRDFARTSGITAQNIHSNLTGRYNLSIERAFIMANTLGIHIDIILEMFYPKEMDLMYRAIED